MSTGLQGQKIMYTTSFVGKVCRKNPGFNVWADSAWPFIFHFPLCTSQGIKVPFENKVTGLAHRRSLVSLCFSFYLSFFLSLTLFFRLIPWSTEALCVHFPAWASEIWTGRHSSSSLPQETRRAPAACVNRASPLSGTLLAFCVNQGISASILSSLIHSLIHSPMPSHFGYPGANRGRAPAERNGLGVG